MRNKKLVALFLYHVLTSISLVTVQTCYNTGNFTSNSTYGRNRNLIRSSLAPNVTTNEGFYTASVGQDPDKVYAVALCRGDTSSESCFRSFNSAVQDILSECPVEKEAISWGGSPPCILRYANRSVFGKWSLINRRVEETSMGSSRLKRDFYIFYNSTANGSASLPFPLPPPSTYPNVNKKVISMVLVVLTYGLVQRRKRNRKVKSRKDSNSSKNVFIKDHLVDTNDLALPAASNEDEFRVNSTSDTEVLKLKSLADVYEKCSFAAIEPHCYEEASKKFAIDVLKKFKMDLCKSISTSLALNGKVSKNGGEKLSDASSFRSLVGSLLYLTSTRPDLMFSSVLLSRFMHSPSNVYFGIGKRVLRYLKGTIKYGIWFKVGGELILRGYTDSDWAGYVDDSKSTSGYVFSFGSELLINNESTIAIVTNPVQHGRIKHIKVKFHSICEAKKEGEIKMLYCKSELQLADIFTKSFTSSIFEFLRGILGVSKRNLKEEC
ncbi:hypothetical protein JRO89_XS06G0105600 [Xanthoceras sorbifolium]|uniref:Gnk2-homologous domain-containing protein n=1 Tax=Xanthoceras sorbifolium TaxID=99658 RepID=A0ABQ8HXL1_9ROSI|nr:hypothetical protein JRO89_XS06G0105600 [Xanthoceras sorbifolium]